MSRIYYAVRYHLDNLDRYLIWYTKGETPEAPDDEPVVDGVTLVSNGKMPVFRDLASLVAYAEANGLSPLEVEDPAFYNLDTVIKWMRRKRPAKLDCEVFLDAWNLLADISVTVDGDFDPDWDRTQKINAKLFWGNNLPAMTPIGRYYVPIWPGRENRIIREVMGDGLQMFRSLISLQR